MPWTPADQDVVLGVAAVLHLLDHRQQALDVALPEEGPVELAALSQILEPRQLPCVGGDQTDGQLGVLLLDEVDQLADLHVRQTRRRDHHVEVAFLDQAQGLRRFGGAREAWCKSQVEIEVAILLDHQLGELAVLLEDEGVVVRGDEEDLDDAVLHQRRELLGVHAVPAGQFDGVIAHSASLRSTVAE